MRLFLLFLLLSFQLHLLLAFQNDKSICNSAVVYRDKTKDKGKRAINHVSIEAESDNIMVDNRRGGGGGGHGSGGHGGGFGGRGGRASGSRVPAYAWAGGKRNRKNRLRYHHNNGCVISSTFNLAILIFTVLGYHLLLLF
ncbi:hypothetical protein Ancab_007547 [Ancistrocladus abbreviatus]